MKDINKITDRIKKLLMKANSTNSPQEAETFLVKAQEMMMKYKIEQHQINLEEEEETIGEDAIFAGEISLEGKWEAELAKKLAWFNGCTLMWGTQKLVYKITFFGSEHDILMTKYFFETARNVFRRLSREQYLDKKNSIMEQNPYHTLKELEFNRYIPYRSVFIRSFLWGACAGLGQKLNEMKASVQKDVDPTNTYGLIIRNQIEKAKKFMVDKHKPKTAKQNGAFGDPEAQAKGREAGKNHKLTIGVEGKSSSNGHLLT